MKVLVACEFSGIVRDAFIARGHNTVSCDLEPTEKPGPHYQGDVRAIINQGWDMMIAFPPCTYLCTMGSIHWKRPGRLELQQEALDFVRFLMAADIPRIAVENPVGIISTAIRKPDQIIQPYYFGHDKSKRTCLWLKNLPPLMTTCLFLNHSDFVLTTKHKNRQKSRSRTFENIAYAMAEQWG